MSCIFMSCIFMSVIFMSCNFIPCYLVRHFHVPQFHALLLSPPISCPAISCPSFSAPPIELCRRTFDMECCDFAADWVSVDGTAIRSAVTAAHVADAQIPLLQIRSHDAEPPVINDASFLVRQRKGVLIKPRHLQQSSSLQTCCSNTCISFLLHVQYTLIVGLSDRIWYLYLR